MNFFIALVLSFIGNLSGRSILPSQAQTGYRVSYKLDCQKDFFNPGSPAANRSFAFGKPIVIAKDATQAWMCDAKNDDLTHDDEACSCQVQRPEGRDGDVIQINAGVETTITSAIVMQETPKKNKKFSQYRVSFSFSTKPKFGSVQFEQPMEFKVVCNYGEHAHESLNESSSQVFHEIADDDHPEYTPDPQRDWQDRACDGDLNAPRPGHSISSPNSTSAVAPH